MAGIPRPSARKIPVKSSESIERDRKIAMTVIKLLPTKKPINAAVTACFGVLAQRAISGDSAVPRIKIPITSDIAVPIGSASPSNGDHTLLPPSPRIAITSAMIINITSRGTDQTLNFSIAR
ncbi:hypothetical protein D3C75_950010 [compost metagenome]